MVKLKNWFYLFAALVLTNSINANAQNNKADGYKGIWFTLGQFSKFGDKYSGGLGTYTSSHVPIAIYSKEAKKTFFVYGGTTRKDEKHLLIMISYYDHRKGTVPKPVIVYDKEGVDDPHDNASIAIDGQGYIWVFVSGRSTSRPGIILKSSKVYDIAGFEKVSDGEMTYPQPLWMGEKGFMYLFTKYTKGRELYWTTSTDGKVWQPHQKLAGMGGHYQVSNTWNGKVFTVFNFHPGGNVDKRTNIYLLQTDDMGKTWKTMDNKPMQTPLTDAQSEALVKDYEGEGKLVYLNDLNFDQNGNPVILAVVSKSFKAGPGGDPREWILIHWKNGQWNFKKVCESDHNYDMGSLYIKNNIWKIIGPTETGPQKHGTGGGMALWTSTNEGKEWKKRILTGNSPRNHSYARRPVTAHHRFYSLWADGNANELSESYLYFTNKSGKKVRVLPYTMEKEHQKPARLIK